MYRERERERARAGQVIWLAGSPRHFPASGCRLLALMNQDADAETGWGMEVNEQVRRGKPYDGGQPLVRVI